MHIFSPINIQFSYTIALSGIFLQLSNIMLEADCGEIPSPLPGLRQIKKQRLYASLCKGIKICLALPISYSLAEIFIGFLKYHVCQNRIKG